MLIVGFPLGFHDWLHHLPVVRQATIASAFGVRFQGQVVEEKGAAPVDFNEVWHLVKPHDGSREWAIAGIEQMG